MDYALSSEDLFKLFEGECLIIDYNQLLKFFHVDQLFQNNNKIVFLLYPTSPNFGHWVFLGKHENVIYFFDPYGIFPDDELDYTYVDFEPHLSNLLLKSPYIIKYNKHKLQDIKNKNSATCGRWCALFAYCFKNVSFDEFAKMFQDYDKDKLITLITSFINNDE